MGGDGSRNGTGKTTIINALSYALYGEALTNIRRDNLINKTNGKNMIVTVDFEIKGIDYRIERARRPNTLKLFINGTEKEDQEQQGDSRETQKEIEKIIGFPHLMFKHLIALNTYTEPFLGMKANDQRAMIEQLLGITELSEKAEVLKELVKDSRDKIKEEEIKINATEASNKRIEKNIQEITMRGKAWHKTHTDKLENMADSISTLMEMDINVEIQRHKDNSLITEQSATATALKTDHSRSVTSLNRSITKIDELEGNVQKAKEGVCPACEQSTAHLDTHEEYTKDLESKLAEEIKYKEEIEQRIVDLDLALTEVGTVPGIEDTFYNDLEGALEHKHNLETLESQLKEKVEDINPYDEQVHTLQETGLQEVDFETINELTLLKDHQDFLYKLLTSKDSFIRKRIIDQNIAYLNHRLAYYLDKLGLPHDVKFASDLSVEITEYGRDLDFDNLSRGERNRLILGLSWAFRDIFESLNHPMNLMCVDELIDSGMDTTGVENALAILKKMNREQGKNILLISHKEELVGRVNNVLTVVKEGGFTAYNTDTEYLT
jgi:DNA repair exonuclease SbcCD ATPase subunit